MPFTVFSDNRIPQATPGRLKRFWNDYSAGIILAVMFLGSWLGQYLTHNGTTMDFWNATFENWESEAWQVFWLLFIMKYFRFKGSPEDKDFENKKSG